MKQIIARWRKRKRDKKDVKGNFCKKKYFKVFRRFRGSKTGEKKDMEGISFEGPKKGTKGKKNHQFICLPKLNNFKKKFLLQNLHPIHCAKCAKFCPPLFSHFWRLPSISNIVLCVPKTHQLPSPIHPNPPTSTCLF